MSFVHFDQNQRKFHELLSNFKFPKALVWKIWPFQDLVPDPENAHYQPLSASVAKKGIMVKNGSIRAFKIRFYFYFLIRTITHFVWQAYIASRPTDLGPIAPPPSKSFILKQVQASQKPFDRILIMIVMAQFVPISLIFSPILVNFTDLQAYNSPIIYSCASKIGINIIEHVQF